MTTKPTNSDASEIATWITPALLSTIFDIRCPWTPGTSLDVSAEVRWAGKMPEDLEARLYELSWPVLMNLSTLGPNPDDVPNLMSVLPDPESAEFARHSLALIWLIDQAPRFFCSEGTNVRWLNGFFDPLARRFVAQLHRLPEHQQPHRREQWTEKNRFTADHWFIASIIFYLPVVHSEDMSSHMLAGKRVAHLREELRVATGMPDPHEEELKSDVKSPLSFSRWMRRGKPWQAQDIESVQLYQFMYYQFAIADIHLPIIEQFGRYPYRNGATGRETTEAEARFLIDSDHFAETKPDAAKDIKADIDAGRWSDLRS